MWQQKLKDYYSTKGLLSNLGIRTLLNKIPLLGDIFFNAFLLNAISLYKMNNIINTI